MNALFGLMLVAGVLYGILYDGTFWKIYAILVFLWLCFVLWSRDSKENPKRKTILAASWSQPMDPASQIVNDYNMENALAYLKKLNEDQKEVRVTMSGLMTLATAWGLYKMRRDVGRLPWGFFRASKKIGVTVLVDVENGKDLCPVTIWDAHKMSIIEVAKYINDRVQRAKKGKDEMHNESTKLANYIPSFIAQPLIFAGTYAGAVLGLEIKALALSDKSFGHTVLTNVGTLGYTSAIAPLCPALHQMSLLCTGAIQKRPVVENDQVVIRSMMTMMATGDHRYGDAATFIPFFKTFRGFLEDPANFNEKDYKDVPHYTEKKTE